MAAVEVGGRRIFFDDSGGNLPALVLLQGFMSARGVWKWQVAAFSPEFRVITMDNRDAGENQPETDSYTMVDLARDVVALLDALEIERASILGHSMGGYVALQFAAHYPNRLDKLVLVATSGLAGGALGRTPPVYSESSFIADPVERTRVRWPRMTGPGFFEAHPDLLEGLAQASRENAMTFDMMARQSDSAFMTHDAREALPEITAPTLVIHGDLDQTIPISSGRRLVSTIPNAKLIEYQGVGHLPQFERLEEFNREVLEFLRG